LELTKDQEEAIAKLESEVKERLSRILTADQQKKLGNIWPPRLGGPPSEGRRSPGRRSGSDRGGPGGPPRDGPGAPPHFELGRVLPPHARDELELAEDQQEAIAKLEKQVKERLTKILTAEQAKRLEHLPPPVPTGPPRRGPGGRDGPPRGGPGGPGGPPPRFELGQVLPPHAREELEMSKDQEESIAKLEKEVKERLTRILTAEQKKKLENLRPPVPGGPPRRGPGGRQHEEGGPERRDW
jgi:Spy/CpxP family protein refolding chaperone